LVIDNKVTDISVPTTVLVMSEEIWLHSYINNVINVIG